MNTERRRNARVSPKELTFVVVRPEFLRSGELLDISRGGLCFQYLRKSNPGEDVAKSLKIDIFIINNDYYLPKVPCTQIYDVEAEKAALFPMSLEFRRCGLQFEELSAKQTGQVELYLSHYTVKETRNLKPWPRPGF
jgi:hypothetical protein